MTGCMANRERSTQNLTALFSRCLMHPCQILVAASSTCFTGRPPHYSELYALALTAYTTKATLEIVTRGCEGDRALVHHMAIYE